MPATPKPLMLIVMDGWGYRENPEHNAIAKARKPTWDYFWKNYPHTLIQASEAAVGLPSSQMGNSEVGHLNLGAGRVVYQEYTRINRAISSGTFFSNKTLTDAVDLAVSTGKSVHILGLLSPGGVHSHEEHIHAMAELAVKRGAKQLYLHAFLDGRDTPPQSAASSIKAMEEEFTALGQGRIASIIGRYYAMDRDHRWPRIQSAYDLITQGKAAYSAPSASEGLKLAYARGESDEFVQATTIVPDKDVPMPRAHDRMDAGGRATQGAVAEDAQERLPAGGAPVRILDGDVVVFMNFRSDRARQITRPFIEENFDGFQRALWPRLGRFVSLTEYQSEFHIPCAFPPERLRNVLGAYLAAHGIHQLRIAETEKYAHVTFFFNGGEEAPFKFEDRILVPSPTDVPTYNKKPEMSAPLVTEKLIEAIRGGVYDVIICNFANADMVGHTGDFDATVKTIEVLDGCLKRIYDALRAVGGEMLITADHGNAEQMFDNDTHQAHTAHTINPVPFLYIGRPAKIAATGALEDIAPTLLYLLGLPIPPEMSGHALVELNA